MLKNVTLKMLAALAISFMLISAPSTLAQSPANAAAKYSAMISCHKIKIGSGNPAVGYTTAHGSGKTVKAAKTAARKAAQAKTPQGYRLRHCTYSLSSRF